MAVLSEKHLEARQPSLTHFSALHIFKIPIVEVVVCSAWLYFRFAFLLFPPLPCRALPAAPSLLFSPGNMLEVIITFASGFISIYSHNNTEKERTGIIRVMHYPVRESSFIMTSNSASSLRHLFLHLFLSLTHTLSFFTPVFHSPQSTLYYGRIHGAPQPVNLCHIIISCGDNSRCTETIMMWTLCICPRPSKLKQCSAWWAD